MGNNTGGYTPLLQLLAEIARAQDADATVAALAMVYVEIDTMALLSCPVGQKEQIRTDFIAWVDRFLKADAASKYQYEGIDVYAARCAVLHSYGSAAALHDKTNPPRKFGYTDNGPHQKDEAARFVLISIAVLIHDFARAVEAFLLAIKNEPELKRRVDSRMASLFLIRLIEH